MGSGGVADGADRAHLSLFFELDFVLSSSKRGICVIIWLLFGAEVGLWSVWVVCCGLLGREKPF